MFLDNVFGQSGLFVVCWHSVISLQMHNLKPRLHQIHLARIQVVSLVAIYMYPVLETKFHDFLDLTWHYVSGYKLLLRDTCIQLHGYPYPHCRILFLPTFIESHIHLCLTKYHLVQTPIICYFLAAVIFHIFNYL